MFMIYAANIQKLFAGCTQWLTWDFLLVCQQMRDGMMKWAWPEDVRIHAIRGKIPMPILRSSWRQLAVWVAAPNGGGGRNSHDLKIHLFPGTSCANEEMSRLSRWISKTEGHFAILTWLFWRERRLGSSFGCSKGRQWNRDQKGVREQHLSSSGWARPGPRNIFGMKQVSKG